MNKITLPVALAIIITIITCYQVYSQTTVSINPIQDNTLYENATGSLSNGAGGHVFVGKTNQNLIRRAVLKFDIAGSLPAGATITNVSLTMTMDMTIAGPTNVSVHTLNTNWGEGNSTGSGAGGASQTNDATWIHTFYPTAFWTNPGGDYNSSSSAITSVSGNGSYTWSSPQMVTDVQNWLNTASSNHGWILIGDETTSTTAKRFESRHSTNVANRPTLAITYTIPCNDPDIPILSASASMICSGDTVTINTSGNLNDATQWMLYASSCGTTPIDSSASGTFSVAPSSTTTYYVRGTGGCVIPGNCADIQITVEPYDDPSFAYAFNHYCLSDLNPSPTISGTTNGTFTSQPSGLAIHSSTGEIDLSSSTSGTYIITYNTPGPNCPASADFNIAISDTINTQHSASICKGDTYTFGSQTLTEEGIYVEIFQSMSGCDSVVELSLQVIEIDTDVSITENVLTAHLSNATYQWIDCNNDFEPISGETSQSFTPTENGIYAVILTANDCSDTSACYEILGIGIEDFPWSAIGIYPNPASGKFIIELPVQPEYIQIEIFNLQGQTLFNSTFKNTRLIELETADLLPGIYLIRMTGPENNFYITKLVVSP